MSSAASDEETEELVAALNDDAELRDSPGAKDNDEYASDDGDDSDDHEVYSEAASPRRLSEETEDEDDELHIAARAGIRLLEENMHFREEVLRLREQLSHVKDEKAAVELSLADRDAQNAALSSHLREAILENQSVLSELSQAKDLQRATQEQITLLEQQLQQQRSPRRRSGQRLSPRKSGSSFGRPLAFEEVDSNPRSGTASPPLSPLTSSAATFQSPTATNRTDVEAACISPSKPTLTTTTPDDDDASAVERRLSYGEVAMSPRRRPTLARLREVEAKYDEEHQKCSSLKLELNFVQRRVSELKPLQGQLEQVCRELEAAQSRVAEVETRLAQAQKERLEEHELIQSLRQTIHVYEQLNDPRQRAASGDHSHDRQRSNEPLAVQEGGATTAETFGDESNNTNDSVVAPHDHNQQLERLDRAAEMIDGRFNLRDENEKLLQQLLALTETVLSLSQSVVEKGEETAPAAASAERRVSMTKERYLEQQVAVLQQLLRRFRLEWQHAHDARVCLEDEKAELLKQMERQRAKLQRVRSASVVSSGSRRASVDSDITQHPPTAPPSPTNTKTPKAEPDTVKTTEDPALPEMDPSETDLDDEEDDSDEAHARRLWERTNAICEALLRPSPSSSREEEAESELLCFALLRRLVDSWTTDKPKRMQLHDWLTNAIRGTGVRRPLYLHELSSEIAVGFQTLMVPILREKFGIDVHVEKRLRNVIVTDLRIQVQQPAETRHEPPSAVTAARGQRVYHSLLSVIDGENGVQGNDEYQDWRGNFSIRRASRGYLGKA